MTAIVLDVAEDATRDFPAFAADGFKTVVGYLSSINPAGAKCWTGARVKAAAAAGLRIGLVHEGFGGVGGKGISAADGQRDGNYCRTKMPFLFAPKGACCYFACDQDFTPAQIKSLVLPYFREIRNQFAGSGYRVGVYGSGAVCDAVMAEQLADLSWLAQSKGWTGYSAWRAKANMVQGAETKLHGADVDLDSPQGDIGDYVPELPASSAPIGATPTLGVELPIGGKAGGVALDRAARPAHPAPKPAPAQSPANDSWLAQFFRLLGGR
jgi:hypothetical protein